ncbi:chalcone isomerase family protein [Aliikangiella sp. IMCC44359]|uniref:chalcone isomerase family protein n=1 Tax=Aliikangiella sp. IMCC44359 TaxID=3459125 RepID=UPI00403ACF24
MKKLIILGLIHLTLNAEPLAASTPHLPTQLKLVGQASLSILWWDIYNAELHSLTGQYNEETRPLVLKLTYQRKISQQDLLKETKSQWQDFNISEKKQKEWLDQLKYIWPNVNKKDTIEFYIDRQHNSHFYYNRNFIGSLFDAEFSQAFINIWLADNSDYPELTKKLTGKR